MVTSIIHLLSNRATASSDLLSPSPPSSSCLILSPPFSPVSPPQDPRRFSRASPNCETIREKTLYPHRAGPSDSNEHSPGLYFKFVIAGFGTTSEKKKRRIEFPFQMSGPPRRRLPRESPVSGGLFLRPSDPALQ